MIKSCIKALKDYILNKRHQTASVQDSIDETVIKILDFETALEYDTHMLNMYRERYARLMQHQSRLKKSGEWQL